MTRDPSLGTTDARRNAPNPPHSTSPLYSRLGNMKTCVAIVSGRARLLSQVARSLNVTKYLVIFRLLALPYTYTQSSLPLCLYPFCLGRWRATKRDPTTVWLFSLPSHILHLL